MSDEMQPISFKVEGELPPKKSGWGNPTDTEPKRLLALRRRALKAVRSAFTGPVRLSLSVHVGDQASEVTDAGEKGFGDLDNFVSGVCDGLMAADPNAGIHELFDRPENADVDPTKKIAFRDDQQVMEIHARKRITPGNHCWYEVGLEPLKEA